ncbi:MAG: outer membrane beta-barrel protein [Desulfuromonadaceae bacterium]|nr:outer membrane beta-barrel protein [Desulfuromonadaceae bacterium]MDD2848031.1 outer membrane beta-barrel protein [Desulfuromonadaceae bacterium]MDD4131227.1 outer membrane beta-barrel protein [Desulfuromonadaceae bacterium]
MKKLIVLACLATTVSMTAGTAMADSIKGRLGVTGKIGFINPADNNAEFSDNKTDTGLIAGGGLIYGLDDHIALELDITGATFGSDRGDFNVADVSFGGQYRFALNDSRVVPFVGAGLDIIATDYDANNGAGSDVDTTMGVHVKGGLDFFLQRNLALTAEAKLVVAPEADITDNWSGAHAGNFDPTNLSTTVGIRYFFN